MTYDPTNGIRTLDLDTEFVVLDSSHEGSIGHTDNNVRTTVGSNVTLAGDNTVNSLIVGDSSAGNTVLAGDGTLTVTSGAVLLQRGTISLDLDFGDAEGVIGFTQGQSTTISGSFAGTNGLTLYQPNTNAANFSAGNGVTINGNAANSTYSGDTHILGRASINVNGFLPYDTRTGDIYVHGIMDIGTSATMNGLNGSGNVSKAFSGAATFTIGDNNANGNFTGILSNNGALTVRKIGTGTQTFGGANTYTGGTLVDAGTFLITNTEGSGTGTGDVSVASGARFGGTGIATGHVTLAAADSVIIAGGVSSIGTLNLLGGLTATNGATFDFDINGASADSVNFGDGNVTLGDVVTVNLNLSGPIQTGVAYTLFTGTGGTWTDESSLVINLLGSSNYVLDTTYGDGDGYIFDADNHSFSVQLAAVPEPSTYALLGGLGVLLFAARRKMRAHRAA